MSKHHRLGDANTNTELRSFLGSANYFRKCVQGFSSIVFPSVQLTKSQAKFDWTDKQECASRQIKQALISAPVLKLPDPNKPYELIADASVNAIGVVLVHSRRTSGSYL